MSRTLSAGVDTAVAAANVTDCYLMSMAFDSGTVYVTNQTFSVEYDGHTWLGAGAVGSIEPVKESADQQAHELVARLSGIPSDMIATFLGEHYQGRDLSLYGAFMDADHKIIPTPILLFRGRMDNAPITLGASAMIELKAQSRLADWNRARVRRYNDADQQAVHPGDEFFKYQEQMVSVELLWGAPGTSPSPVQAPAREAGWDDD